MAKNDPVCFTALNHIIMKIQLFFHNIKRNFALVWKIPHITTGKNPFIRTYFPKFSRHFFVQVDYGYGVGSWNPGTGGHAHIVTAYGNTVYYTLAADGTVSKEIESPDLYLEYVNQGGKLSPTEFVSELVTLIG